ncbi:TonB-dependent receptor plug domain-containing protein [Hymenobacter amundsenii]|uniref:TonB-dependent receptor plug domain-containing protein n=1 Tax=Hymenobacter amundsenii TaxID=2006685 RepID=UPI000F83523B|nr:TonB-dependent receptor plug domain-containing protein [Hymenobacter amundsenii]
MSRYLLLPLLLLGFAASAQNSPIGKVSISAPRNSDSTTTVIRLYCGPSKPSQRPLFIIDGRVADSLQLNSINPDQIDTNSIRTIRAPQSMKLYGNAARNGVILMTTKPTPTDH